MIAPRRTMKGLFRGRVAYNGGSRTISTPRASEMREPCYKLVSIISLDVFNPAISVRFQIDLNPLVRVFRWFPWLGK
ncbi:hypothetical protein GGE07_005757 [Sinorhizobium terangae]|nr:hypothetical protein [Sinorhizobium terangae]